MPGRLWILTNHGCQSTGTVWLATWRKTERRSVCALISATYDTSDGRLRLSNFNTGPRHEAPIGARSDTWRLQKRKGVVLGQVDGVKSEVHFGQFLPGIADRGGIAQNAAATAHAECGRPGMIKPAILANDKFATANRRECDIRIRHRIQRLRFDAGCRMQAVARILTPWCSRRHARHQAQNQDSGQQSLQVVTYHHHSIRDPVLHNYHVFVMMGRVGNALVFHMIFAAIPRVGAGMAVSGILQRYHVWSEERPSPARATPDSHGSGRAFGGDVIRGSRAASWQARCGPCSPECRIVSLPPRCQRPIA